MGDELILVDIHDHNVGHLSKEIVHRNGRLHRAFSIFLIHDGKILLQRREEKKYHSGGLWTNACCSHPRYGENLKDAVYRRLREELNVKCNLIEIFSFVYYTKFPNGLTEYEYDHVFLGEYDGTIIPNPTEISSIKWVPISELCNMVLTKPEIFTSWFLISFPKVLQHIERGWFTND